MSRTTDRSNALALAFLRQHLEVEQRRAFLAALDALVAENQRLRDALEQIDHYSHMGDGAWDAYLHVKQIAARAILAGTPSEDT
jgi:hypothetical protein